MPKFCPVVYLDLDGVCCDFVSAALRLHNVDPVKFISEWPKGRWEMNEALGIPQDDFWEPIGAAGASFWANLEPYPWFHSMYAGLSKLADVSFLTSPSLDPFAAAGKVLWLQNMFGRGFRSYNITNEKFRLGQAGSILIDDHPDHCKQFKLRGGSAVLFPQPWNNALEANDPAEFVVGAVKLLLDNR